jgi:hypothetical protein
MDVYRLDPVGPPQAYKTYTIAAPLNTHFVPATCAEAGCPHYIEGWQTAIDEATELGQRQAHYIRRDSGRGYTEQRLPTGLTLFTFPPGQRCFASGDHKRRLEREERFIIRGGDYRGNPAGIPRAEVSATSWVDDFGEHQDRIAAEIEKG